MESRRNTERIQHDKNRVRQCLKEDKATVFERRAYRSAVMTGPKNDEERLEYLIESIEDSILSASDEEIVEDFRGNGQDPAQIASSAMALIRGQLNAERKQRLATARQGYLRAVGQRSAARSLPADPRERRGLLERIMSAETQLPAELTLAFREGKEISDRDVTSMLEDLAELGFWTQKIHNELCVSGNSTGHAWGRRA